MEDKLSNANAGSAPVDARCLGKSARGGPYNVPGALRLWEFIAALAGLLTFGCGTHATLNITAPASAIAGSPITITVTAMVGGSRDTVINSWIHITCSDTAAVLPPYYQFTSTDAGSHTFANAFTLMTPGSQTITATVLSATGITGTAKVTVSATTSSR